MKIPLNAIAETIAKLEFENETHEEHIAHHQGLLEKNLATIATLEPLAEWGVEEPVVDVIVPLEEVPPVV